MTRWVSFVALLLAILVVGEVHAQAAKKGKPAGAGQQGQNGMRGKANAPGQQVAAAAQAGLHGPELAAFVHQLMQVQGVPADGPQAIVIHNQILQAVQAGLRGQELAAFAQQCVQAQAHGQNARGKGQAFNGQFPNGFPGQGFNGGPGMKGAPAMKGGQGQGGNGPRGGAANPGGGGRGKGR